MNYRSYFIFVIQGILFATSQKYKLPTVGIAVLVRNKGHTLPYFLSCIHQLDYPKDRIYIWFQSENNADNTVEILEKWNKKYGHEYSDVFLNTDFPAPRDISEFTWDDRHFRHVIALREQALQFARDSWADYLLMIDADVFLVNKLSLKHLIGKNMTVVAPMLNAVGLYSNFWCGMEDDYYYKRTDDYIPILKREKTGCFPVPMVHTAVLINLREVISDKVTYDPKKITGYDGPEDDIITFAISANKSGIALNVCNDIYYGLVTIPIEDNSTVPPKTQEMESILNIKLESIAQGKPLPLDKIFTDYVEYPEPSTFGFDKIFMINLERRVERRDLMLKAFKELGMQVTIFNAVDGRELNPEKLKEMSIYLMPDFEDPYHKRPMKMGEIGCFLSHYNIWKEISDKELELTLILEDDVHFEPYFKHNLRKVMTEALAVDWDLIYFGRKILNKKGEVFKTDHLIKLVYSYWTLGYAITLQGARKLLAANPLNNMLPVDEFLPIMFDQHPNETWKKHFPRRNLIALSAHPLLIKPTHYTGEPGYISDTEQSDIAADVSNNDVHLDL